eukprot:CAMPEP_0180350218 /NCGR_PEP_ID=MMETSP0989-20121125/5882_1 /TAXON_ID=697907 /ORGANISM="non described non described, Strain CCMP2293" /LENGTH=531 /DNA_ID=CAMNT_0022339587 /DNA_START=1 /DNA_END=1596 /DNA_ORIENTATION=+
MVMSPSSGMVVSLMSPTHNLGGNTGNMVQGGLSLSSPHTVGAPLSSRSQSSASAALRVSQSREPKMVASTSSFEEPPIDPDMVGVGIYLHGEEAGLVVQKITPGSSADKCTVLRTGDVLVGLAELGMPLQDIRGQTLRSLRHKILGLKGSYINLHFTRSTATHVEYEVELMRGSPDFVEASDLAEQLKDLQASSLKDLRQTQDLEEQVRQLSALGMPSSDPRVAALEAELDARMHDMYRFEELLSKKQSVAEASAISLEAMTLERDDARARALELQHRNTILDHQVTKLRDSAYTDGGLHEGHAGLLQDLQAGSAGLLQANAGLLQENAGLREENAGLREENEGVRADVVAFEELLVSQQRQKATGVAQENVEQDVRVAILEEKLQRAREALLVVKQTSPDRAVFPIEQDVRVAVLEEKLEQMREVLHARNTRDQDVGRRLRTGHSAIAAALRDQQTAAAAALEALPHIDLMHSSLVRSLQSGQLVDPMDHLSMPPEPTLLRHDLSITSPAAMPHITTPVVLRNNRQASYA